MGTLLSVAACGGSGGGGGGGACFTAFTDVARISVFPAEVEITAGETFQLATQAFNPCGFQVTGFTLSWQSSDPAVATVGASGRVTGKVGGGPVRITATLTGGPSGSSRQATGVSAGTNVVVRPRADPRPPAEFDILIFPPDPVVAAGETLQMAAMAVDPQGNRIPGVSFVWDSSRSDIAAINPTTGMVTAVRQGVAIISARATQAATTPGASTSLVVLDANGAPMPVPDLTVSPSTLALAVGASREAHATVSESLTGAVIPVPITWLASVPGVVTVTPLSADADVIQVTGTAQGETELTAQAVVDGSTVQGAPITVRVLPAVGGGAGPWQRVQDLPYPGGIYAHRMSAVGGYLLVTGGVTGGQFAGGFREDVSRARPRADGTLERRDTSPGWDRSPVITDPDPAAVVLASCAGDPPCLEIRREATNSILARTVRYQVARHAQAATDTHVYIAGGVDAQVDLGIDPSDPGAVGPDRTRYSDRVLIGAVAADGTVAWHESGRLPVSADLPLGLEDVPGRTAMAAVQYRDWLYLLGGWSWVLDGQQYVGRNRDEILRAAIDPATGELGGWTQVGRMPEALNKHAAVVMGDWLLVAGGATGADENSPTEVTDRVYIAPLDPQTGDILGDRWRETTRLPQPLEHHAMVSLPGDPRLVVVGGDTPANLSASADAYVATLDPATGRLGDWALLPALPESAGLTSLAAAAVGEVDGAPAFRVYISGGGVPMSGNVTDLDRREETYFIDLAP